MLEFNLQKPMRIMLVDDHPIVRFGFISLLKQVNNAIEFYEADNASDAIMLSVKHDPHVALIDLTLAGTLNVELIKRLSQQAPKTAILVVSMHDEAQYAERVMHAGARGYVMKQVAAKSIVDAIQVVHSGKIWLSEKFRNTLVERMGNSLHSSQNALELLSDRELTVFRLIGLGMKKREIAIKLNISPNTIETYRANIKQKLGFTSGSELARAAFVQFQKELV